MSTPDMNTNEHDRVAGVQSAGIGSSGWLTVVLCVLVVFVMSKVVGVMDTPAMAEMAISDSGYTMMTTNGGADEILVLVDSREESILVYRVAQGADSAGLELLERESLSGLFTRARAQAVGGP
ncbi:MAG: hypothetical protein P1U30_04670 [Phycisphaerales bacterium]|nr:hypothetical protein [Phycisphaerales bacterium]